MLVFKQAGFACVNCLFLNGAVWRILVQDIRVKFKRTGTSLDLALYFTDIFNLFLYSGGVY